MSEEEMIEYVSSHTGHTRRKFLERLLVGAAFAAPVIASFSIGGAASPKRSPLDAGANMIECGPNTSFDIGSNLCVPDDGSNTTVTTTTETPATTTTETPTTTTETPATTTAPTTTSPVTTTTGLGSGAGVPGEIPATK